jgi:hypothetical protein
MAAAAAGGDYPSPPPAAAPAQAPRIPSPTSPDSDDDEHNALCDAVKTIRPALPSDWNEVAGIHIINYPYHPPQHHQRGDELYRK